MGFLNEQLLQRIVDVPRSANSFVSLYSYSQFPGISTKAMSMPLTQSGSLRKIIIAAEFDVTVKSGWPELQIIRNATDFVFTTNTIEPKPTGYLNVYEYRLLADEPEIRAGDVLNISWHRDIMEHPYNIRFSLARYNNEKLQQ